MKFKYMFLFGLMCLSFANVIAQQQITVNLNEFARDDKFERLNMNMALFEVTNDTILSWDFEGMKKAEAMPIIKPEGYKAYAYGYLFFAGNSAGKSPGFLTVLVANPYHTTPTLYIDLNNNFNFTDDDFKAQLPWRGDTVIVNFCLPNTEKCSQVKFTRHKISGSQAYKELLNEFYQTTYPNRKFIGMDHCYRQQQYQIKSGVALAGGDSIRFALYDGNNNGIFNEADSDRFVVASINDTVFYPFDDLYGSTISKKQGYCFVDKNGKQFEFKSATANGSLLTISISSQANNADQIKQGKKLPRFKYITWKGERKKIAKLRRYHVYIYFGSPQSTNFTADTIALRELAHKYPKTLKVIGFIEVNKSYELSIFGQYSYLNWTLAYKDKNLNKKLGIRGLPSSIYTKKRRRVIQYNLTPNELLQELSKL
ncbi:MAG: hypothetical protein KBE91_10080 [Bacteroidia bacterium]|nr:hypothetical protein [Bacteroidia bacterium]